ncbi:ABC transporter substrate-binding protein [Coraliomargarita parva]|uniref:ABC transporter substrate-binding protein n=1 Tax=Coraliomargarita parva TaxID=3014050 RepID=UPI0022B59ABC|nr:ABC transporter substrate-binding protein [Coraliomargarita parva]
MFFRFFQFLVLVTCLCGLNTLRADEPEYAQNFNIEQFPGYRLLTVSNAYRNSDQTYRYALVPKTAPLPADLPKDALLVRTPVERIVCMETVYIGYLEALGALDRIVGAATTNFISNPTVRARVETGEIAKMQIGQNMDIERMLLIQPDLILTSISGDPSFDVPPKLIRSGLPVVLSAGYMERHPLARSEWLKFIAAFLEKDAEAEILYRDIATRYNALVEQAAQAKTRPTVFCGAPYSGIWHVPGGKSYTAQAIADASGRYLWAGDDSQGGIPLDTERVFLKAAKADIWLNPSSYRTMPALRSADPRFAMFQAARQGKVFNHTRQVGPEGGNPIWEYGVVHPDEVLADLIQIFHPGLLAERELLFYERLN